MGNKVVTMLLKWISLKWQSFSLYKTIENYHVDIMHKNIWSVSLQVKEYLWNYKINFLQNQRRLLDMLYESV